MDQLMKASSFSREFILQDRIIMRQVASRDYLIRVNTKHCDITCTTGWTGTLRVPLRRIAPMELCFDFIGSFKVGDRTNEGILQL
jgi:hypothetical protein